MRTVLTSGIMVGMVRLMGIVGDVQSGMWGRGCLLTDDCAGSVSRAGARAVKESMSGLLVASSIGVALFCIMLTIVYGAVMVTGVVHVEHCHGIAVLVVLLGLAVLSGTPLIVMLEHFRTPRVMRAMVRWCAGDYRDSTWYRALDASQRAYVDHRYAEWVLALHA